VLGLGVLEKDANPRKRRASLRQVRTCMVSVKVLSLGFRIRVLGCGKKCVSTQTSRLAPTSSSVQCVGLGVKV